MKQLHRGGLRLLLSMIVSMTAAAIPLSAQETYGLSIDMTQPFESVQLSTGFQPVFLTIENSTDEEHELEIAITDTSEMVDVAFTRATVSKGETARVELPMRSSSFGSFRITVSSDRDGDVFESFMSVPNYGHQRASYTILNLTEEANSNSTLHLARMTIKALNLRPDMCPENWVNLVAMNQVSISYRDFSQLDQPRRTALRRYTETGGCLVLMDADDEANDVLHEVLSLGRPRAIYGLQQDYPFGLGSVRIDSRSILDLINEDAMVAPENFSLVALMQNEQDMGAATIRFMMREPPQLRLPGFETVPVRSFVFLISLFAILVGPVNFYVLSKKKKRTLALLTIPCIAIAMTLFLTGYAFWNEGIGTKVIPRTVTHLDQTRHRFSQVAKPGIFAGIATNSMGFPDTVSPLATGRERTGRWQTRPLSIDWTHGTNLGPNWIPSRTTTEFMLARSGPCRKRVQIKPADSGKYAVTNALGVELQTFFFRTPDGLLHLTGPIDPDDTVYSREFLRGSIEWESILGHKQVVGTDEQDLFLSCTKLLHFRSLELGEGEYLGKTRAPIINDWGLEDPTILPGINFLFGRFNVEEK